MIINDLTKIVVGRWEYLGVFSIYKKTIFQMEVTKSDNTFEEFDREKVKNGICEAFSSCGEECNEPVINSIVDNLYLYDKMQTQEIRHQVEDALMSINKKVAKCYIDKYEESRDLRKKRDFIRDYINASNAATGSKFDANANVSNKNIVTLGQELYKENNIKQNRYIMHTKIKSLFSKKLADQYIADLESHVLYKHDESGTPGYPYCVAITMYPFLIDGLTKLGGQSKAPTDTKSFCGEFINLIYSISSQFMGACMHGEQQIFIKEDGNSYKYTSKDFVEKYLKDDVKTFHNYQGEWEYANINGNVQVLEDGRYVDVKKVYRRKYAGDIYVIKTKDGYTAKVSKDHVFKQLFCKREFESPAKNLKVGDTLFMNKDYVPILDKESRDYKKGWLIGMICGDGCITRENAVSLSVNHAQEFLGDIFNQYLNEIYGFTLHQNEGHKCFEYSKYNADLYNSITSEIIGKTSYDKHIDIRNKSNDYLVGFLDGLFCADGGYTKTHGVAITLTNKDLIQNVADIVNMLDICHRQPRLLKGKGNRKDSYVIYIPARIIKYLKHTPLKMREKNQSVSSEIDCSREVYYYGANARNQNRSVLRRTLWSDGHCKREEFKKTDVIESIEIIPNDGEYVYEIETSSHWYNCGGFITHNCATPEFLMYLDYFIRKDYGDDYIEKLNNVVDLTSKQRTLVQVIDNFFQQVVHSMNMPAGNRGYQTVFWNVGYFDKPYFDGVFGDFLFPDGTAPKWETLSWLQKHFMKWFNAERTKYVLTFPVETMALLTDGKDDYIDKEYADFTAEMWSEGHSFFCYLSDSPDALSSCCFSGEQKISWKSGDEVHLTTFKEMYDAHPERPMVRYMGEWQECTPVKLPNRKMFKVTTVNGDTYCMTDNHINVTLDGDIETKDLTTKDYLAYFLPFAPDSSLREYIQGKDGVVYVRIKSIEDYEYSGDVYCVECKEHPYFDLPSGLITHNCRLKSSLKDLDKEDTEHNHTTHQYSMGTASVATGSKSVMTINLPRVIQNAAKAYLAGKGIDVKPGEALPVEVYREHKEGLLEAIRNGVRDIVERVHKYQTAFNETIKDFLKAGMLDVYNAGFIDMKKQYLTVGVNGIVDAAEFFGIMAHPTDEYKEFVNNVLETINTLNRKDKTRECMFNTEFVPAENLAAKNYKWDKKDGYYVSPSRNLYSSYFYAPEDKEVSILDKFRLHGKDFVQYLDGGSALHENLNEHLSKEQYRQLMKHAANVGCNYFTFNVRNSVCNDCGYISKHTLTKCPHCGSENIDYLTRVIGYLKRISSFSEPRQVEAGMRAYN